MKLNTSHKIKLAALAYSVVSFTRRSFGKDDQVRIRRGGVNWDLDLREGIDFSIFLLGGFELGTLRLYQNILGKSARKIVLDIGANVGAHTLPLALLVVPGGGKVYAFEPTCYAYGKLLKNITLNPSFGTGIEAVHAMLVAEDGDLAEQEIYSSWPLAKGKALHEEHLGELKTTNGAEAFSLDSFVIKRALSNIDFIKLDVDGHEASVLAGSWQSLERFRPTILMEWSPNLFRNDAMKSNLLRLLKMGYLIFDGSSGKLIDGGFAELDRRTPNKGSMNILLRMPGK